MNKKLLLYFSIGILSLTSLTGCQGLFNLDSEQVLFVEDNPLDSPTDTVYSVIGVLNKLQRIADRTVLLGEIRGDLVSLTPDATLQLQALANFTAGTDNVYNAPEDYYAVINNCNYFIANVDTSLMKRNNPVFMKEYAVMKTFRAWTYLQLAQIYGSVPFITEPILTEKQASINYEKKDIKAIAAYFIDDLKPYINTPFPTYGSIGSTSSERFFIPVRLLLGDMCLWSGRYVEAATYYHDYLTLLNHPMPTQISRTQWTNSTNTFDGYPNNNYGNIFSANGTEVLTYIPMETTKFNGMVSDLPNVFNSTTLNKYFYQATFSNALKDLSKKQSNCKVYENALTSTRDTLYAPSVNTTNSLFVGDLRLAAVYNHATVANNSFNTYSTSYQSISKFSTQIFTYRRSIIYLRYAEAMNRAGYSKAAFTVLKYGLTASNIVKYVDINEVLSAGNLLSWDKNVFTTLNTLGIHSRGSGEANADKHYIIPHLPTRVDTTNFVEDLICDEMALESAFEGYRFYDLIRISMHRNDAYNTDNNAYLADKVAGRKGTALFDQNLHDKLMNQSNWYLPLK
jgi:starch-binding outer membrane protein, SusD/RagB family